MPRAMMHDGHASRHGWCHPVTWIAQIASQVTMQISSLVWIDGDVVGMFMGGHEPPFVLHGMQQSQPDRIEILCSIDLICCNAQAALCTSWALLSDTHIIQIQINQLRRATRYLTSAPPPPPLFY